MKHSVETRRARRGSPRRTVTYYATQSGGTTLDAGEGGGNPFASALIELSNEPTLRLRNLPARLRRLTAEKSNGHQIIERIGHAHIPNWKFQNAASVKKERRDALVLIVSEYSGSHPAASLIGAARDERRIAAMLAQHGFSVTQGIGPERKALIRALKSFRRRCRQSDIGVIYSTGHGIEINGIVYLLPGDYPMRKGFGVTQLKRHAVSVTTIVHAATAREQNLVFFAGCRTRILLPVPT